MGQVRARRRIVIAVMLGAWLLASSASAGPATRMMRVGLLTIVPRSEPVVDRYWSAFEQELRERGWIESQTIAYERRHTDGDSTRVRPLLAELAAQRVDVIWTGGNMTSPADMEAANGIPIVFAVDDPVGRGLVASLARPGGTATGISRVSIELQAKRIELLKQVVPSVSRVAVLMDPVVGFPPDWHQQRKPVGIDVVDVPFRDATDLASAVAVIANRRVDGVVVVENPVNFAHRGQLVAAIGNLRIPTIFSNREFVDLGGLMSYGVDLAVMLRQAAVLVDKILRGANPADLPVEQPLAFELAVNQKTARSLGLAFPREILMRADRIVE